jgi:hypothetical protein
MGQGSRAVGVVWVGEEVSSPHPSPITYQKLPCSPSHPYHSIPLHPKLTSPPSLLSLPPIPLHTPSSLNYPQAYLFTLPSLSLPPRTLIHPKLPCSPSLLPPTHTPPTLIHPKLTSSPSLQSLSPPPTPLLTIPPSNLNPSQAYLFSHPYHSNLAPSTLPPSSSLPSFKAPLREGSSTSWIYRGTSTCIKTPPPRSCP